MSMVPWPDFVKASAMLTVEELLTLIENKITTLRTVLDNVEVHAGDCRLEAGASHEPVDEHAIRANAYDDLVACRDALDLAGLHLQAAENGISHVGGGRGGRGSKKKSKKKRKKAKRKKKVTKKVTKKPPKPEPDPRAEAKKK